MLERDSLLDFLASEMGLDTSAIEDDTPLFSAGLIDSFALVTLLTFIESACSIRVSPMDVNLDNMDTVGRLMAFAAQKTASES